MGVECELGHACPREPQGPGERQKLLRFLTQSLARPGSLCDVPRVTGGQAGGGARGRAGGRRGGSPPAALEFPPISADPYLADTKRRGARSA